MVGDEDCVNEDTTFKKRSRPRGNRLRKSTRGNTLAEEDPFERRFHPVPKKVIQKEKRQSAINDIISNETTGSVTQDVAGATRGEGTAENGITGGERTKLSSKKTFGPLTAPKNLRVSVRMDFQPDVCKDYKETGYCGFGDACKFLHDRSNYKAGWQLDRDWVAAEAERREKAARGEDPDEDLEQVEKDETDGLPFACFICRKDFNRPVVTLCGHYFCEDCALNRMQKDDSCALCKQPTRGTVNPATKLQEKLGRRQSLTTI